MTKDLEEPAAEGAEVLQALLDARVAELYAGESIPVPRVEIAAGNYPAAGTSFGVAREDGVFRLDPSMAQLHEAIVDREAFLLGFSPKAKKNASVQHVASWLAFQRIGLPAGRAAFWDAWTGDMAGDYLYHSPPAILRQFDRIAPVDVPTLHASLLATSRSIEAMAGRVVLPDITMNWVFRKALTLVQPFPATTIALAFHATRLFLETGTIPTRKALIDACVGQPVFAERIGDATLRAAFNRAERFINFSYQPNYGLAGIATVNVYFSPAKRLGPRAWDRAFDMPGLCIRFWRVQGSFSEFMEGTWNTYLVQFMVPRAHLDTFFRHLWTLEGMGLFSGLVMGTIDRFSYGVNYDQFVAHGGGMVPAFGNASDDPGMRLSSIIPYHQPTLAVDAFMNALPVNHFDKLNRFVNQLTALYSLAPVRYGALHEVTAQIAGINRATIKNWLAKFKDEIPYLLPSPRLSMLFAVTLPYLDTIIAQTRGNMTTAERDALARPFLAWSASDMHFQGQHKDGIFWNLRCPAGHVAEALQHVKAADPKASVMLAVAPDVGTKRVSMFPWFAPRERTYADPTLMLDDYTASIKSVLAGERTWDEHERACIGPWQARFGAWLGTLK